jgi:hypothetical protein
MNPYIERILGILGNQEPILVLESTPQKLEVLLESFSPDDFESSYEAGKWTAREILCHLADTELLLSYRIRQTLAEDNYTTQAMDQDLWAKRYKKLDPSIAVETFKGLRRWNLALFSTLGFEEWSKELLHPERGRESVDLMVRFLAGHDLNHLGQLERINRIE